MKKLNCFLFLCVLACLQVTSQAHAAILYGHGNYYNPHILYRIDTVVQSVTFFEPDPDRIGPDIEISPDNSTIYMSPTPYDIYWEPSDWLFLNDPTTGLTIGTTQLSGFPSFIDEYGEVQVTDSTTAMAFVGSTLYASFSKYGYGEHTRILGTIDLSTGEITEIGKMTGMNMMPTGGLEYVGGIMYAVSAGTGLSSLYTINLDTGAATLVAPITLNDDQIRGATALAFADGKMYTLINRAAELYSVDLITGVLTEEFNL